MRALSIRQPFAELILRGLKTIEYRSRPTRIIGQRFWIYASKARATSAPGIVRPPAAPVISDNLSLGAPPPWMAELANALRLFPDELPTGVIVGSAVIEKCTSMRSDAAASPVYEWHLADVQRAKRMRKPTGHPQPVWFDPFKVAEHRRA